MTTQTRFIRLVTTGVLCFGLGFIACFFILADLRDLSKSNNQYSGVFVSATVPPMVVSGEEFDVRLTVEELAGLDRTITELRVEGLMLLRAIGYLSTEPPFSLGEGNISDGWSQGSYSIPLSANSSTSFKIFGLSKRSGPAHGIIRVLFSDNSESVVPIQFTVQAQ